MSDIDKTWESLSPQLKAANEVWLEAQDLKKRAKEKQEIAFKDFNTVIQAVDQELVSMGAVEIDIQLWVDMEPGHDDKILGLRAFCVMAAGPVTIELKL